MTRPPFYSPGGAFMADDKSKRGSEDRAKVSLSEQYEVAYFADRHGLSQQDAKKIISEAGSSRARADELAAARKGSDE